MEKSSYPIINVLMNESLKFGFSGYFKDNFKLVQLKMLSKQTQSINWDGYFCCFWEDMAESHVTLLVHPSRIYLHAKKYYLQTYIYDPKYYKAWSCHGKLFEAKSIIRLLLSQVEKRQTSNDAVSKCENRRVLFCAGLCCTWDNNKACFCKLAFKLRFAHLYQLPATVGTVITGTLFVQNSYTKLSTEGKPT